MKAPDFWWRPPGLAARLLQPASVMYGFAVARRLLRVGVVGPIPVVCIGNVTTGGSGKTPTALHVAKLLRSIGLRPAFLTRGYGGRLAGPVIVEPARHRADEVGDEPLLLARDGLTILAHDRPSGAALAASLGADAIVMDDGLQNPSLRKDLTIAVFDGASGVGNGLPLPAGPLRAPLAAQWPLIDAVLVIGSGNPGQLVAREAQSRGLPAFHAEFQPDPEAAETLKSRRVLAFAGIGRPGKFFDTLRGCGAELVETRSFPDHHRYRAPEIDTLAMDASRADLTLVTTEKDDVRLTGRDRARLCVVPLPITLALREPERFARFVADRLRVAAQDPARLAGNCSPSRFSTASGDA